MITLSGEEKSWTVKRISSDPPWKDSIPDLERYPLGLRPLPDQKCER